MRYYIEKIFLIILLLFPITLIARNPASYKSLSGSKFIYQQIPYSTDREVPVVEITVAGRPRLFIMDTAAGITCIKRSLAQILDGDILGTDNVRDSQGNSARIERFRGVEFSVGDLSFIPYLPAILDDEAPIFDCWDIDGIIGADFFCNFLVVFDSREGILTVTDDRSYADIYAGMWQKMKLLNKSKPLIPIIIYDSSRGRNIKKEVLFDSGSSGILSLVDIKKNAAKGVFTDIEKGFGTKAVGIHGRGADRTFYRGTAPYLIFGNTEFADVPVVLGNSRNSLLGFRFTEFGKVVLDFPGRRYCFIPGEGSMKWAETRVSHLLIEKDNRWTISLLWEKNIPLNLRVGDSLIAIGGKEIDDLDPCYGITLEKLFEIYEPAPHEPVVLKRNGIEVIYPASELLPDYYN